MSLDAQRARLVEECERRGIESFEVIEDAGVSGKNTDRPGIQRALSLLRRKEADLLITTKLDRLARSVQDVLALADASKAEGWDIVVLDGSVHFDTTTPHGKLQLTMVAALAEWERAIIGTRISEAFARKRCRGDAGLIPPTIEERVVGLYRDDKLSMQAVADLLNREAVETARGGRWHASTVQRVVNRAWGEVATRR